ncbi:BREX system P-loop protein BrxC [Myxococcus sp. AM011]|uniref:BREX system P-loop protein BrxC n=1 Tax=Myxococcus sp. AM011 TaxID=2745200 RepID=UPI001595ED83|nr:BREX system P-loop protein BrxC [Myxococcus sp. AM011]NVJ19969.1 BREX system P-loop protein BrxC [Myxococcus sp. AM011]
MKISDLFARDVTRDIPPVVYFHEQSPEKLADEVSEYIITGGYPEADERHRRVPLGIHEQYVRLLNNIARELDKKPGPELPASWISGFYGSGKSSFAKLLGLALDGRPLPDGRKLSEALLARDDSPNRKALVDAWENLARKVDSLAVVFDIGGEANDGEHIHSAVARMVQRRLGYSTDPLVADAELRLEKDQQWEHFLEVARRTLGREWSEVRTTARADEHFSRIISVMEPATYSGTMTWFDSRVGTSRHTGLSSAETVRNLEAMLSRRAPGKTLFIVVDEVSQYVHQNDDRMLKLQSFVSELGQRLKGKAWLLATGQQKLEEASTNVAIGKLKDRFPPSLRVHLATTNIRDVVHRRLLKKHRDGEPELRRLFGLYGAQLKLFGYECGGLTEEDFVEVYPMLPGQVDLLMALTTSLRQRSTRTQGDDYAIRGLLQLLGELFREQKLATRDVGELVTLDLIYDVQQTAFDSDVQAAMARILSQQALADDAWARRVVKAIALLELNNDKTSVTQELIASCLYSRLGDGNPLNEVKPALERLRNLNLIGFSEKEGYKIQSSAGQEWQRDREEVPVSIDDRHRLVREKLAELMRDPERPRLKGRAFYWTAYFSDGRQLKDERLLNAGDEAAVTLDFRFLSGKADRSPTEWSKRSAEKQLEDRIVWVAGESELGDTLRELGQSRGMIAKYAPRKASMSKERQRLLFDEEIRAEDLETKARAFVERTFVEGDLYFRGQHQPAKDHGGTFSTIMSAVGSARLPQLYTHHTDVAVPDRELEQLLAPTLAGVSQKFLEQGLGLLTQDGVHFLPSCQGTVPSAILSYVDKHDGTAGNVLLQDFARPPYGYPPDVVRACLLALLRARKVKVKTEDGTVLTSPMDASAREVFLQVTKLKRASLFPNRDETVTPRDRTAMRRFFELLGKDVEPIDEALAAAVFEHFAPLRERLRTLEQRFSVLPGRPAPEEPLQKLAAALESCRRVRDIDPTVRALKEALPALQEGAQLLNRLYTDLTEEVIQRVRAAADVRDHHVQQLVKDGSSEAVAEDVKAVEAQLGGRRPWVDLGSIDAPLERIRAHYRLRRGTLLEDQEKRAEAVRARLRQRAGFEKLNDDETHQVFRPIGQSLARSSPEAIAPTLYELRMDFLQRLDKAAEDAEATLDELVSAKDQKPVVRVELNLRGREVADTDELGRVLDEIRERVTQQLERGHKVRLG